MGMEDIGYQRRNRQRLAKKMDSIVQSDDFFNKRCLDIGCNDGQLCRELLAAGAKHVTGVEIAKSTVKQELRDHEQFDLLVGDVSQLKLPAVDVTFCLAVLHHVVGEHGWDVMHETLRKILSSAKVVYFEFPLVSETGRYAWKTAVAARCDASLEEVLEEYQDLFNTTRLITTTPIHGISRRIIRVDQLT